MNGNYDREWARDRNEPFAWHWYLNGRMHTAACGAVNPPGPVWKSKGPPATTLNPKICKRCMIAWNAREKQEQEQASIPPDKYTEAINWMCENRERFESVSKTIVEFARIGRNLPRDVVFNEGINCDAVSLDDHTGFQCHGCRKKTKLHIAAETTDGQTYYRVMLCPSCISTMNQKLMLAMAGHIEGEA